MTTDSNREAFEDGLRLEGTALERDAEYGYYLNIDIENHWQTWQAATAHNKEKLREVRDCLWSALGADFGTARGNEWTARAYEKIYEMIGDE